MRGNIIPEPWASHHLLTMDLCATHHQLAHASPIYLNELRWHALELFAERTTEAIIVHTISWYRDNEWTAVQTIKDILMGNSLV